MFLRALLLAAALPLATNGGTAEPLTSIPNPRARDGSWVTDMAGALRADTVTRLNDTISAAERQTGIEVAVVVVSSLDGATIEQAAEQLFRLWGIGKEGRDNGLLFLWSTGDRRVRVEVGYGLEATLPDGTVGAILDTYVIPRFRGNQFDEGVIAGVDALLATARNEEVSLSPAASEIYEDSGGSSSLWLPLLGALPLGAGSVFGYRRWRRYRRRRCPQCDTRMALLPDYEDDALLQEGQVAEERIGSVEYDVWKCPGCAHNFTLKYPKWLTKYDKCPQCSNRTKSSNEVQLAAPTTSSTGRAHVFEKCAFCTYEHDYVKELPKLSRSSSSSSSSSSGGSSFGGGRSGGGGASRGY